MSWHFTSLIYQIKVAVTFEASLVLFPSTFTVFPLNSILIYTSAICLRGSSPYVPFQILYHSPFLPHVSLIYTPVNLIHSQSSGTSRRMGRTQ